MPSLRNFRTRQALLPTAHRASRPLSIILCIPTSFSRLSLDHFVLTTRIDPLRPDCHLYSRVVDALQLRHRSFAGSFFSAKHSTKESRATAKERPPRCLDTGPSWHHPTPTATVPACTEVHQQYIFQGGHKSAVCGQRIRPLTCATTSSRPST